VTALADPRHSIPPPPARAAAPAGPPHAAAPAHPPHRAGRTPNHLAADAIVAVAGIGFGAIVASVIGSLSTRVLDAPGGIEVAIGRFTGLIGAYLLLVMVVLVARLPALERLIGHPRLTKWHRRLSPWPLLLLTVHAAASMMGYAKLQRTGVWHEFGVALSRYEGMLAAIIGLALLFAVAAASIRAARRRMSHEKWWQVHLLTYLALALSFSHQIATGASFVHHPWARLAWILLWLSTAGIVLACRVGLPIWRTAYHRLRVVKVVRESDDVVSLVVKGRRLDRLAVSGGQYFQWRFMARGLWLHAHPYSISALPRPPYMRVTIKGLGDHSSAVTRLAPGTRIAIEGPYGAFTKHALTGRGVALIAAGVGVTPIRALLEDLPTDADPVVVLRASSEEEMLLGDEVRELARARGGRVLGAFGSRHGVALDPRTLRTNIPDLPERDVFICGPEPFTRMVAEAARRAGASRSRLHVEGFGP
jgi:ferredoxin-NADP reductase/DMSO/TMAO reductase YedYZ heme-binding membrane subunit